MKKVLSPFRVGLLVILAGAILFVFLSFVRKGGLSKNESVDVYAYFKDASGLSKKSRVQIAGIPVGEIAEITLEGTRAKAHLRIQRSVKLHADATLAKRSESLLGDYMLDLTPGSESEPELKDGDEIRRVIDSQGMEQVMSQLSTITQDVQAVTGSLRTVLGGDKGSASIEAIVHNLERLSEAMDKTVRGSSDQLNAILENVNQVSADIRGFTSAENDSLRRIVGNVEGATNDVRDVIATVKKILGSGEEGELKTGVAGLKETLAKLDATLANVEEVTRKVKEGKGVVGELVSDERLGQRISETVDDVADFAQRLTGLEAEVSAKTEYAFGQGKAKTTLGIRLSPKPDKYYLIEFVDDPRGSTETVYIQANPPSVGSPAVQKQTVTRESLKVSAQFAKRFSYLTLRFGIIESTGGIGLDLSFPIKFFYLSKWIEDAIVFKVDAFNFSVESLEYPRLRASLRFTPIDHVYVTVGVDDIINKPNRDVLSNRLVTGRDFFIGVGVYFTDADLKSILAIAPVGALQ